MATEERETSTLIGSDKVEGTAVYGADESQIGSIERVMIEPIWQSLVRGPEFRRFPRYRGRSLPAPVGVP